MNTKNTFLSKDYDRLISQFTAIKEEKVAFLEERKARHKQDHITNRNIGERGYITYLFCLFLSRLSKERYAKILFQTHNSISKDFYGRTRIYSISP